MKNCWLGAKATITHSIETILLGLVFLFIWYFLLLLFLFVCLFVVLLFVLICFCLLFFFCFIFLHLFVGSCSSVNSKQGILYFICLNIENISALTWHEIDIRMRLRIGGNARVYRAFTPIRAEYVYRILFQVGALLLSLYCNH